jgi:hypothetical protein
MTLTGRPGSPPLGGPPALVDLMGAAASVVSARSGGRVNVDGLALLGERAALSQLTRQGTVSCGGSARLVPTSDGWLAVSLARMEDVEALPAWLERTVPASDPWPTVLEALPHLSARSLDSRAGMLGLPIAAVGSVGPPPGDSFGLPVRANRIGGGGPRSVDVEEAIVLDLSSLWAGPLCGQLLALAGARVIKVESTARPDGARNAPPEFFDLLNGLKQSVALDLLSARGRDDLRRLILWADVVIESARPRALEQMGIAATDVLGSRDGPLVWASITSHGRGSGEAHRVGFGDTAAAAGGLVTHDADGPCFIADAVADPLAGLVTAAAVLEAVHAGGSWLIDAAMAPMSAAVVGDPLDVSGVYPAPPRARQIVRPAVGLGTDTKEVCGQLLL